MKLTVPILRAAYAYLAETPPFNEWNLPDAEEIDFVVLTGKTLAGRCSKPAPGRYRLAVSDALHNHTDSLMATMAHEMIHVHEFHAKIRMRRDHGPIFRGFAKEVCDAHGFDPGNF